MPKSFNLMVLTPEREFYNGKAEYVSVQTIAGSIGVLADHEPMVSALDVGALVIHTEDGQVRTAFHSEGFIEVRPSCVYILSQACEWPEEIDEKRALEAEQRAQERIEQERRTDDLGTMGHSKVALMRAMTRRRIKSMSSHDTK
jgi:F-type H+-transporting ATPase subunit epsilon